MTNNLAVRIHQHRNPDALSKAFTTRYKCFYLVYFEHLRDVETCIRREKEFKGWRREKKEKLIKEFNLNWDFIDIHNI